MAEMTECPDCASTNIIYSKVEKGIICRDCGGVFIGNVVPEKKAVPKPVAKASPKKAAKKAPAKKKSGKKKRK